MKHKIVYKNNYLFLPHNFYKYKIIYMVLLYSFVYPVAKAKFQTNLHFSLKERIHKQYSELGQFWITWCQKATYKTTARVNLIVTEMKPFPMWQLAPISCIWEYISFKWTISS